MIFFFSFLKDHSVSGTKVWKPQILGGLMLCSLGACGQRASTRGGPCPARVSEWASLLVAVRTSSESHAFSFQSLAGDQNYFWPGLITRSHFTACLLPALSHGGPAFPCDSGRQTTSHHHDGRRPPPTQDSCWPSRRLATHWVEPLGVFSSSRVQGS